MNATSRPFLKQSPFLSLALSVLFSAGCGSDAKESDDETSSQSSNETSESSESEGCAALPEAANVNWMQGEDIETTAESTPERIKQAGERTWELALDLLKLTDSTDHPSHAASPASMYFAMGMTYGIHCSDEIARVMRFPESGNDIHNTLGKSLSELESRSLEKNEAEEALAVSFKPSFWSMGGGEANSESNELTKFYGGSVHTVEANNSLADTRTIINCVIEEQSEGLLPDFLPEGQPAADTSGYEINVTYLQAPWKTGLDAGGEMVFQLSDGSTAQLDSLSGNELESQLFEDDTIIALDLPLRGNALSALIVMPKDQSSTSLDEFVSKQTSDSLHQIIDQLSSSYVQLKMPVVSIPSTTIDYYKPLGLECPVFTLRKVLHGSAFDWDDKGIRAAAATVNEGWLDGGGPGKVIPVTIDRPFLFFVRDAETDFVLYSGRFAGE